MQNAITSDTSCLVLLDKIDELDVLRALYGNIITIQQVASEFGSILPNWIEIVNPINKNYQAIIEASLDKASKCDSPRGGIRDCLLIIDDLKGRKFALQLGPQITGTLGVLIEAKSAGYNPFMKPVLQKIKQTNFRISAHLEAIILAKVGEDYLS